MAFVFVAFWRVRDLHPFLVIFKIVDSSTCCIFFIKRGLVLCLGAWCAQFPPGSPNAFLRHAFCHDVGFQRESKGVPKSKGDPKNISPKVNANNGTDAPLYFCLGASGFLFPLFCSSGGSTWVPFWLVSGVLWHPWSCRARSLCQDPLVPFPGAPFLLILVPRGRPRGFQDRAENQKKKSMLCAVSARIP